MLINQKCLLVFIIVISISSSEISNRISGVSSNKDISDSILLPIDLQADFTEMNHIQSKENVSQTKDLPVNDCYYCRKESRLWYSSFHALSSAALLCGYNAIEIRFDNTFKDGEHEVNASVFLHLSEEIVSVDSVVYSVYENSCFVKRVNSSMSENNILLSTPGGSHGVDKDVEVELDVALLRSLSESFSMRMLLDKKTFDISILFSVGDITFLLKQDHLSRGSTGQKYQYVHKQIHSRMQCRLLSFFYRDICDSMYESSIDPGPRIEAVKVSYPLNYCKVDLIAMSNSGIDSIKFGNNSFSKSFIYNGDKNVRMSVPLYIPDTAHFIIVEVIDINHRTAKTVLSVYDSLREVNDKIESKQELYKAQNDWGRKSPAHSVAKIVGSFTGNPVSYFLGKYIKYEANETVQKKLSFVSKDTTTMISLPLKGRVTPHYSSPEIFRYTFYVGPENVNETKKECLEFTSNSLLLQKRKQCRITFDLPCGNGHFVPSWKVRVDTSLKKKSHLPLFLMCSDVTSGSNSVTIGTIPMVIDRPLKRFQYAAVVWNDDWIHDTLSFMYIVTFIDKSRSIFYREIIEGKGLEKKNDIDDTIKWVKWETDFFNNRSIISREEINTSKKIMRLDVFAYSTKHNETFGAGSIWVQ